MTAWKFFSTQSRRAAKIFWVFWVHCNWPSVSSRIITALREAVIKEVAEAIRRGNICQASASSGEHEAWRLRRSCAPASSRESVNSYAFASSHYLQSLCASAPLRWKKIRGKQFARICSNNKQKYYLLLLNEIVVYCCLLFSSKWIMELWSLWPLGACDAWPFKNN